MSSDSESDADRGSLPSSVKPSAASGSDSATSRKRQLSVPDMVRRVEQRRSGQQRVRQLDSPRSGNGQKTVSEPVTLEAIERLIEVGNGRVVRALEAKFEHFERRIEIVETECYEKDLTIQKLQGDVAVLLKERKEMEERIEGIDMNRRLSALVLTCDDFPSRSLSEDVELMAVQALTRRLPELELSVGDIQVAHRLQKNNKIYVKFLKRRVRDGVFERRFELFGRGGGGGARPWRGRGASSGRREMAPLYMAESLVPRMQRLYQTLLAARRPENGARVASVFSRRGHVYCRMERGGSNIRIRDEDHLRRLLGGALPALPGRGDVAAPAGGGEATGPGARRPGGAAGLIGGAGGVAPAPPAGDGGVAPAPPAGAGGVAPAPPAGDGGAAPAPPAGDGGVAPAPPCRGWWCRPCSPCRGWRCRPCSPCRGWWCRPCSLCRGWRCRRPC